KPTGIVSNSPGALGGVSAAKHLQNILPGISGPIMGQPEIYLNAIGAAFNDKGELTSEPVQKVLQQYIDAFAAFVEKQNKYPVFRKSGHRFCDQITRKPKSPRRST